MNVLDVLTMAFGLFLNSFPYFILGMALAWDHLRYGRRHALSVMTAVVTLHILAVILLTVSLPPETWNAVKLSIEVAYMCLILAAMGWIVRFDVTRLLFMAFFVKHIADFTAFTTRVLANILFPDEPFVPFGLHHNMIHLALLCFIFPFMLWFIRRVTRKLYVVESSIWRVLWLVPALFYVLNALLFDALRDSPADLPRFIIQAAVLYGLSLMVYLLIWETLRTTREKSLKEENERRLVDENAALARMNRMRAELIATVTHETMTPLAVLSGYSELVAKELRRKRVDEQIAKDLDTISEETQRIKWLMDELLNHARDKSDLLLKTRCNLTGLAENTARLYAPILERENTTLALRFPDDLPDVYARANEVTQVLLNLLQNARDHTANGAVAIAASWDDDFVTVTISDSGSGISDELLPRVFERGVTGSGGTGLGLSICKEILEAHGGTIELESKKDKGATARFALPVWKEES